MPCGHITRKLLHPITQGLRQKSQSYCMSSRSNITNANVTKKRNELFGRELARQMAHIKKVEKIKVDYKGPPENCSLLMNKGLSTPFNCAMHMQELLMTRSVLALVNGEPWDMHRPLVEDCELQFQHFKDDDPSLTNETFWRSCSVILGYVLERAFKSKHYVELCSFPRPNVKSGSFVYDARLDVGDWIPNSSELSCISRIASKLGYEDLKFERLDVDASVAQKIFEDNKYKSQQIPAIAAQSASGSSVTLYRMGDHVEISRGPLMSSTNLISRYMVTALHSIESPEFGELTRVQGVAVPKQLPLHYWGFERLCDRAAKLNTAPIPRLIQNFPVQSIG